jgi:hypothetical protein
VLRSIQCFARISSGRGRFQAHTFDEATLMKTKSQTVILDAVFGIDPLL